jgi:acetyl-CoA acetyltransferase
MCIPYLHIIDIHDTNISRRFNVVILNLQKSYAVVGVPADIMGVGPAYAIPEAVRKAGRFL